MSALLPKFSIKQLLDAGVHFGHKTMRWNPKMAPYIYGARNNTHIIDLQKTVPLLHNALDVTYNIAANNGRVLFVSTKRQASEIVETTAKRCGQYYVNHRWLGGMLTNWGTVSQSIKTLRNLQNQLEDEETNLNKKERLQIERRVEKLERALGGIKDMGGVPDLVFIIDTNKEHIAIKEANTLEIPLIAVVDTNSDPDNIGHIIPGNDDSTRSIQLYCDLIADSILAGMEHALATSPAANAEKPAAEAASGKTAAKKDEKSKENAEEKAKAAPKKEEAEKEEKAKATSGKTAAKKDEKSEEEAKATPKKKAAPKKKTAAKKEEKSEKKAEKKAEAAPKKEEAEKEEKSEEEAA